MTLWTANEIATHMSGTLRGAPATSAVTGISIDSRSLAPGDAFFAIKGVSMDGHLFVLDALKAGASLAVVSHGPASPAVVVDDVQAGLEQLGVAARARIADHTPVVAVTGSVGKTGTKEMLRLAFGQSGKTHAATASFNNQWGVPLTLARMPADTEAAIFEIGMNHAGEIRPLTKMVRPTIAIVTTVAAVHLEFFDSVAGIAAAKAEIFEGLMPGGTALIPADNEYAPILREAADAAGARILTFAGESADAAMTAYDLATGKVTARVLGETVSYQVNGGAHIARNSLAVLLALKAAGRSLDGAEALSEWRAPMGRGRKVTLRLEGGEALLIDEAFNASPTAMAAAIVSLGGTEAKRRVAILGDMLELGPSAPALHRGLKEHLVKSGVRIVHTVGAMMNELHTHLPAEMRGVHVDDAAGLAAVLPPIEPGDAVLVKGSKAMKLAPFVADLEAQHGKVPGDV